MKPVEEVSAPDRAYFAAQLEPAYRPFVVRGLVADWPIVKAGQRSIDEALMYVAGFDNGRPADIIIAPPSENGRFFYDETMRGFNFDRHGGTLRQLMGELQRLADKPDAPSLYAGSTPIASHLPGFIDAHHFPLLDQETQNSARIWLGSATQVAIHYDMSDNFAAVAFGERTFTLFPPEAVGDLYIGPLDNTPAGPAVSMVDPLAPDLTRYPRYEKAARLAQQVTLYPGDVIYIPALWWHHVVATQPVNMLVNYWHNEATRGGGFLALMHAMLTVRELPPAQRQGWKAWFDHFVFDEDAPHAADHLPDYAKGVNGPSTPQRDERIRQFILQVLSGN